jgi:hypothetical protein
MEWTSLAKDRDKWRALVRAIMNLHVPWSGRRASGLSAP